MAQQLTSGQCAAYCNDYLHNAGISTSLAAYLWLFASIGLMSVAGAVAFGICAAVRYFQGGRPPGPNLFRMIGKARESRKEKKLRGKQEERMRAMRISGLEVEMDKMGRSKNERAMQDCEEGV